jgi:hypothetical protein
MLGVLSKQLGVHMKTNKFKKIASLALLASIGFVCAPASASLVLVTDQLLASASLANSGDATELAWIRNMVGDQTLVLDGKADATEINNGNGQFYVNLMDYPTISNKAPGYFLVKFGNGGTNSPSHYVFKNLVELNYLVWNTTQVPLVFERLSHFTLTGGGDDTVPPEGTVPEPASAALFGLGLLGLYMRRRNMR